VVGNFCFVHPAKPGISSNLNLITDKGNIYSFTLTDITDQKGDPDLKVIIQPADPSNIVAANGPAQYVPVVQLEQARQQISTLESHVGAAVDEYKSAYPLGLMFDYSFKSNEAPFDIQSIYCGGPGCSDSFRRFLSGSSVFGLAAGGSGGRWALTGSAMLPLSQCGLTGRVSLSHPDDGR
jgi:hypothetical protein